MARTTSTSPSLRRSLPRRSRRAALALAALLAASAARAASPEAIPVSPEAALTAGAVLASDDVGGGGWYNPASLGAVKRSSIQVGASAYSESATVIHGAAQAALPWGNVSGDIRSLNYSSVPSVFSYSFRLREGLGFSIGIWTTYHDYDGGTKTITSAGPFPGTPALGTSYAQTYAFTERRDDTWYGTAIGWQATRRLRVGAMLQVPYSTDVWSVDLNAALRTDSSDPLQSGSHIVYSERGDRWLVGLRSLVGMQLDVTPRVRVAAAVRGPTLRLWAGGPLNKFLASATLMPGYPPSQSDSATSSKAGSGVSSVEPVRVYGGVRYAGDGWTAMAEGDWHPGLDGQFGNFKEAWNARAGGTWLLNPNLMIGAGLFHDSGSSESTASRSALQYAGFTTGVIYRSKAVLKALGGSDAWDLLACTAVRGAYGWGSYRGVYLVPFDSTVAFPKANADVLEGSISFLTAIMF